MNGKNRESQSRYIYIRYRTYTRRQKGINVNAHLHIPSPATAAPAVVSHCDWAYSVYVHTIHRNNASVQQFPIYTFYIYIWFISKKKRARAHVGDLLVELEHGPMLRSMRCERIQHASHSRFWCGKMHQLRFGIRTRIWIECMSMRPVSVGIAGRKKSYMWCIVCIRFDCSAFESFN